MLGKRYIGSFLLLVALFIAAGFAIDTFYQNSLTATREVVVQEYQNRQSSVAVGIAGELERRIKSLEEKMKILASVDDVVSGDSETCSQSLRDKINLLDLPLANLSRVNAEGVFYCSVLDTTIGRNTEDLDYVNEILQSDKPKTVFSRKLEYTNSAGEKDIVIAVHVPVYDGDKFVGTLGGALFMKDVIASLANPILKVPPGGWLVIMDDNGDVLFHPDNNLVGENVFKEPFTTLLKDNSDLEGILHMAIKEDGASAEYKTVRGTLNYGHVKFANISQERYFSVLVTVPVSYIDSTLSNTYTSSRNATIAVVVLVFLAVISIFTLFLGWNRSLHSEVLKATEKLAKQNEDLEKARRELDLSINKMREQNEEMKVKAEEAERLNKIMVERELKMIDLKKHNEAHHGTNENPEKH